MHDTLVISMLDGDVYPHRLMGIADAPPLLFVRGSLTVLSLPSVAVVGTRQASEIGLRVAHTISGHLTRRGLAVVSGLALGIDTAAHLGALDAGGQTIAVLAHGLDTVAPTRNRPLAERILSTDGALVSEHPPGVPPRPVEFARRNRIQSGLAHLSVMVESRAEGGAMIQARFAFEQGRPILTVLSTDGGLASEGAARLLSEFNALPVRSLKELDEQLDRLLHAATNSRTKPTGQLEFEW
jgi:DNA processing protein